jgi:DNA (cytosine-5)-methyltransferase 1
MRMADSIEIRDAGANPPASANNLTVCGLFAGIGGIEAGLAARGHHASVLCEVDPNARAVLRARFPRAKIAADVRGLRSLPRVGLLAAGFPCSDLSQAGRTEGINGQNSGLVGEVFRLLDRSQNGPDWLLLENVPFMLSLGRGAAMRWLVGELEGRGFMWAYRVIDSRAFGLPHRRPRVIVLASREKDPRPVLLGVDAGQPRPPRRHRHLWRGFYWTEGNRGTGLVLDAIPPLKSGSTLGIPSPPAIWARGTGRIVTPALADAERLQGFRAGWTAPAGLLAKRRPIGVRWRLIGNAVSVPTAAWLGSRLASDDVYDSTLDDEVRDGRSWPIAGWGAEGERCRSEVSAWPVRTHQPHLHDFLAYRPLPLSFRAAAGFHRRLVASHLRPPQELIRDLERHVRAMSG